MHKGKINVLYILAAHLDDPICGGVGSALRSWVTNINRAEFNATVILPMYNELAKELEKIGVKVIAINTRDRKTNDIVIQLMEIFKNLKIHVIHTQEIRGLFFSGKAVKRLIINRPKIIFTRQGITLSGIFPISIRLRKRVYLLLERYLYWRYVDYLNAVSTIVLDEMKTQLGVKPANVIMLENRVDVNYLKERSRPAEDIRKELGFTNGEKIVGMAKRLVYEKGITYFIQAAKEILDKNGKVRFIIVGEGPDRQMFEDLVKELDISNKVKFLGFREDACSYINVMDVFCHPTIGTEGLPIVVVEAMALNKPVISTKIGVEGVIDDGVNGVIIPEKDTNALSTAILKLLNNDDLRKKYGQNASEKVMKYFHIKKSIETMENIYRACLI